MNGLHLFIDNSNLYIAAQSVAREDYYYDDDLVIRLRISYESLLEQIRNGRKLMETVLVGSRPPENDGLWKKLIELGISPRIFDRSYYSKGEKRVDAELTNAIRDTLEDNNIQGTIALVAGDQDYIPTLERCIKKGWNVEVYFWEHSVSPDLSKMNGVEFISLNKLFEKITFKAKQRD